MQPTRPDRVVINLSGEAVLPQRAKSEYNVEPDVIFERDDGWTLGAPESLKEVAASLWADKWVAEIYRDKDGGWIRYSMVEDPERPWALFSSVRKCFSSRLVPITGADAIIPIAEQLIKRIEEFSLFMHPGRFGDDGIADVKKYWQPLVRQMCLLKKVIKELELYAVKGKQKL